jgi:spermidine synthase
LLAKTRRARILEIGVQSGGFAVPVILANAARSDFSYTGVDNLEYTNAVPLRLILEYLQHRGVAENVRFIEGDSSVVLGSATPSCYDLILLDHYKPKYAADLYRICAREVLSADGAIVLHDVLTHAADDWKVCERVCREFGYGWMIDAGVSQGAAIVRRGSGPSPATTNRRLLHAGITLRWQAHAAVLRARRAAGRFLRATGWRQAK